MQPDGDFDVNTAAKEDVRKLKRLWSFSLSGSVGGIIEYTFWGLAVLASFAMVVVLPWVGQGKLIGGRVWLFGFLGAIILCGGVALGTRAVRLWLPEPSTRGRRGGSDMGGR